ncbi:MAG: hypothetical protein AVDCRST_MAG51-2630 [uncultured Ramlibacter sp.]|uniref:Uncharacterized protein n=1 Tax=uncultured Ramlibacter sp. TaxID=260755 RepID=A0A6J4Q2A6_9BURK|nr:MAG: hypothetical protein AVDCRST_MAG51-2630 [uncultured Ramlibacter sp.]
MVQRNVVYRKSEHGAQALAKRDPALSLRSRSLLILVDGKRSVEDLAKLSTGFGEIDDLLGQLDELGMVEAVPEAGPPNASAPGPLARAKASAPAPLGPAKVSAPAPLAAGGAKTGALTLPEAKRAAVRRLTDLLGPTAEDLCLRIEGTRTPQDFLAAVKRAEMILRDVSGAQVAATFMQDMQAIRPA